MAGAPHPTGGPRPLLHPLCGSNPGTVLGALVRERGVSPRHVPQAALALGAALARWPFSSAEQAWFAARRAHRAPIPAPLFIIGHLRSGTTHVQNVLHRSGRFGQVSPVALGLPWDMLGLGALLRPLLERVLPEDRYVDRVRVGPDSPQEDEIALANMQRLSYYHAVYFPRRFTYHLRRGLLLDGVVPQEVDLWRRRFLLFLAKVALQQGGRRLLIKNPVHTARIALLRAIWPDAQFVHVHRDPRRVYVSTVHYFRTLLAQLALQDYDHVDVESAVLETYPRVMTAFLEQSAGLLPERLVEVPFERFERAPMAEIERIYRQLRLDGLEEARPRFEAYLQSVRGYAQNRYPATRESVRLVERAWAPFVERWGEPAPA